MSRNQSLAGRLADRIHDEGPLTFHDWMQAALYDPQQGYYFRNDIKRWGREGDYRTSPERSELFAATFARYFAHIYDVLEQPSEFFILECGAGDGSFAFGVLRTLQDSFPVVFRGTTYLIQEVSEDARKRAQQRLSSFHDRVVFISPDDIKPFKTAIVFSNELFDAFPVHRVTMDKGELVELYVTLDANHRFTWTTAPLSDARLFSFLHQSGVRLSEGQKVEINLELEAWFKWISKQFDPRYLITVDYGAEAQDLYNAVIRPQGSLRAYARHNFVEDFLNAPGSCDITASVDWSYVKRIGAESGFEVVEFKHQDEFLLQAGVLEELQHRLSVLASDAQRLTLTTAAREMILPGGMASSFQVLVQRRKTKVQENDARF